MFEQLKRLAMIGIGGTALAVDKITEQIDEMVEQGRLTVDEGKRLTEELIQNRQKDRTEEDREEIEAILLDMNLAQRQDIEALETRVTELEDELHRKEDNNI